MREEAAARCDNAGCRTAAEHTLSVCSKLVADCSSSTALAISDSAFAGRRAALLQLLRQIVASSSLPLLRPTTRTRRKSQDKASTSEAMSFALRTLSRSAASTSALRAGVAASPASGLRLASTSTPAREDPKSRAQSIINALPGNSPIAKTSYITLGTGLTAAAISTELFVVTEEVVVLGSFAILATFIASSVRGPYAEWAEGQIEVGIACNTVSHCLPC